MLGGCLVDRQWVAARSVVLGCVVGLVIGLVAGHWMFESFLRKSYNQWQLWRGYVADVLAAPWPAELGNHSMHELWPSDRIDINPVVIALLFWVLACLFVALGRRWAASNQNSSLPLWGAIGLLVFLMSSPLAGRITSCWRSPVLY